MRLVPGQSGVREKVQDGVVGAGDVLRCQTVRQVKYEGGEFASYQLDGGICHSVGGHFP
jgi:hypothetical protein